MSGLVFCSVEPHIVVSVGLLVGARNNNKAANLKAGETGGITITVSIFTQP